MRAVFTDLLYKNSSQDSLVNRVFRELKLIQFDLLSAVLHQRHLSILSD